MLRCSALSSCCSSYDQYQLNISPRNICTENGFFLPTIWIWPHTVRWIIITKLKILQVGSDLLRRKWQVTILTFKIYVAAWPSSHTQLWIMSTIRTVRTPCATLTLGLLTGPWAWCRDIFFSICRLCTTKTLAGSFHVQWHFHNGPLREWRWVSSSASCPTAQRNHLISDWLFNDVLVEWRQC